MTFVLVSSLSINYDGKNDVSCQARFPVVGTLGADLESRCTWSCTLFATDHGRSLQLKAATTNRYNVNCESRGHSWALSGCCADCRVERYRAATGRIGLRFSAAAAATGVTPRFCGRGGVG